MLKLLANPIKTQLQEPFFKFLDYPSSNQAIFCNTSNQWGVVTTPSLDFPNRTPYEIDFDINR